MVRGSPETGNLCMVRPELGISIVKSKRRLTPQGWAIIVLGAAALALGGCGRKGGLDLPPNAMNAAAPVDPDSEADRAGLAAPVVNEPGPAAAKGRKRSFVLDPLLGN